MEKEKFKNLLQFEPLNYFWTYVKTMYIFVLKGIIATKALFFFLVWNIKVKNDLYKKLRGYGICDISPFNFIRWKNGVCYLKGVFKENEVFIKTGGVVNTIERERSAIEYVRQQSNFLRKHVVKLYPFDDAFIVEEMLGGQSLANLTFKTEDMQNKIVLQMYEIYGELKRIGVHHLDIRPQNFIVTDEGIVFIIDFGYSLVNTHDLYDKIEKNKKTMDVIINLGSKYAPKNGTLDDAYSMLLTLKYICPELINKYPSIWKKLNEDIGVHIIEFTTV